MPAVFELREGVGVTRREYETPEYAAMLRRMIQSYGRRVAAADPEDLTTMLAVRDELDAAIVAAVRGQVDGGASWARVASGLGVARESAFQRYRRRPTSAEVA